MRLAVNDLQDNIYATPALVDKRIYIRTIAVLLRIVSVGARANAAHRERANREPANNP